MTRPDLNVLSLFAGIGGLELGLERAGMTVVGQVEIDPYCRRVLDKHWPEVPRHDDVRTCVDWWFSRPRPRVDLVCGGFPCQPVSVAGRQLAQADERWLWPAMASVLRGLRPRYVLVENVPGLLVRGMGDVLGDLATLGYDAEWDCVPAQAVGAPHRRDRAWIVGWDTHRIGLERPEPVQFGDGEQPISGDVRGSVPDTQRDRVRLEPVTQPRGGGEAVAVADGTTGHVADADGVGRDGRSRIFGQGRRGQPTYGGQPMADTDGRRLSQQPQRDRESVARIESSLGDDPVGCDQDVADADGQRRGEGPGQLSWLGPAERDWWSVEPDVGRVAHGVPARVDRLRALGNAVVPQVAEHVGRLILDAHLVAEVTG